MNIQEEIRKGQLAAQDHIKKSLAPTFNEIKEDIIKGKAAQVGEIREWGGVKMRKEATGWVPVKGGDSAGKPQNPEAKAMLDKRAEQGKATAQPQDLGEAAKTASEAALMNATKVSTDPAVREAAHKELQRRKSEEAQDTFKAPEGEKKEDNRTQNQRDEEDADNYRKSDKGKAELEDRKTAKKKEDDEYHKKKEKQDWESEMLKKTGTNVTSKLETFSKMKESDQKDYIKNIKEKENPALKGFIEKYKENEGIKESFEYALKINTDYLLPMCEEIMKERKEDKPTAEAPKSEEKDSGTGSSKADKILNSFLDEQNSDLKPGMKEEGGEKLKKETESKPETKKEEKPVEKKTEPKKEDEPKKDDNKAQIDQLYKLATTGAIGSLDRTKASLELIKLATKKRKEDSDKARIGWKTGEVSTLAEAMDELGIKEEKKESKNDKDVWNNGSKEEKAKLLEKHGIKPYMKDYTFSNLPKEIQEKMK